MFASGRHFVMCTLFVRNLIMSVYSTSVALQSQYDDNEVDDFDFTVIPRIITALPVITGHFNSINS